MQNFVKGAGIGVAEWYGLYIYRMRELMMRRVGLSGNFRLYADNLFAFPNPS